MKIFSKLKKKKSVDKPQEQIPKIEYKGGTKFANNNIVDAYIDFEELGGYPFVKTVLIGLFSAKTKRDGCKLEFVFKDGKSITLDSDNAAVESNQIKKSKIYYTEIDFEISDEELNQIKKNKVKQVLFKFKKDKLILDKI